MTPSRAALLMCATEVLGMLSFAAFQTLIPFFQGEWRLSNTDAGWISGIYFAGYVAVVPVLTSLSDRIDPKKIILWSLAIGAIGCFGFALFAQGFWTALLFRTLQGIGLAGTYMPGLKVLSDLTEGPTQSRYVSFYTATFGIGAGLSYIFAGEIAPLWNWQGAFHLMGIGAVVSFAALALWLPRTVQQATNGDIHLLDFRPVFRNTNAMTFIWGYTGHNWELFAVRSWMVALLVFTAARHPEEAILIGAPTVAAIMTFVGVPASIFGNEMAVRFGRRRTILVVTTLAVLMGCAIGFASAVSYWLVAVLALAYGCLLTGDSAALTAGTVASAAPGQRGATLAVHSFLGFMGGIFGPLGMGIVLDVFGNGMAHAWGLAFIVGALGSVMAFAVILRAKTVWQS